MYNTTPVTFGGFWIIWVGVARSRNVVHGNETKERLTVGGGTAGDI
jgi:hypothetical protein